jgi:glycosyltransferase involved in cell wall biosynthesis
MKPVLMVAFHYPPYFRSSGVHRTLKFSRYLPDHGWRPIVLSADPRAYGQTTTAQLGEIPGIVEVTRSFALDSHRHLAIGGKSLGLTAIPDQWSTWLLTAIPAGLRLIRRHRPAAIWSTYPIPTAHLVALTLHRLTGIPWVADFRDIMTTVEYPRQASLRRVYGWIERAVMRHATRVIQTTPSAQRIYIERYAWLSPTTCRVIANGYDEEDFADLSVTAADLEAAEPLRLVHSGLIYDEERDPRPFFRALARLRREGIVKPGDLRIDLRGAGITYHDALRECADAAALLLLQGPSCDGQIPAKAYEYLRLQKPILALTTTTGDTGRLLMESGGATIIDLMDEEALYRALPPFFEALRTRRHPLPDPEKIGRHGRRYQAGLLADCLDTLDVTISRRSA